MLLKWKCILTNWINCYCNERDSKDLDINLDSLLIIISHLRRNLSLDDSRSSLLEAHNIQEFILEKYPDFKFENGTCDPHSEEDLHLSASLLLFFVCVNSKNIDLKNAMCSKLSSSDQEIIMKFSKCLMACTNITSSDVLQAITEACGQDIVGAETVTTTTVAETPPALRSLHSEVRRLQAALDAERFDRNYLQEELSRTNLKLEKLTKVKEQYKQEIFNLKARVSDSCGEDNSTAGSEASHNNSVKLAKQLEQAEERLAHLQEELSNVEFERNGYKNKLDELKRDRDKYFALSQQENIRASQLAEELDSERRQSNSLRELITELRQHNRLNRMDSSQLECDDLDTSVHSLQHNSSVCSEVCASIIEVQLAEERSKIATLKNQMQMLQDQLTELNNKYEKEKNDLGKTLSEKECDIMNLKHRINEEIESKNVIKSKCDNDITKLNNEINELEQTLKDTTENARKTIDAKMQEIQTLQEEKLSLLQSFSNETSKLEYKVQELKKEIESEKTSKQKMREDFNNHMMKLKEKVLNRNNELVELQNKIVTKGEEIESLQIQLRNEKDMRQELINKHNNDVLHYNNVIKEQNLSVQKSSEEITELRKQVQQYYECIEEMNRERNNLNASLFGLKEEVKFLTSEKQIWLKEKEKLANEFDEKNETINSLKSQLQTEIQFKNETQSKLREVESHIQILLEEKTTLTNKLSSVIAENSNACEKLKDEVKDLTSEKQALLKEKEKLKTEFDEKIVLIRSLESQLQTEIQFKNEVQSKLREVESDKEILTEEKISLTNNLSKVISENSDMCQMLEEKVKNLTSEKQIVLKEKEQLQDEFDEKNEIINTLQRQLQTEVKLKNEIQSKLLEVETNKEVLCKENTSLTNKLSTVIAENSNTCEMLKEEIENLTSEKQILLKEKVQLHNEFGKNNEAIKSLESQLQTEIHFRNEIQSKLCQVESEKEILHKELTSLTNEMSTVIAQNSDACVKLNREVKNLTSEKQMLLKEKERLQKEKEILCQEKASIKMEFQNLTSEKELLLKEKEILQNKFDENDNTIYSLENQLQTEIQLKHEIQSKLSDVVSEKEILCEEKTSSKMKIENLTTEKEMLLKEKEILQNKIDENTNTIYSLESQLQTEIQIKNEIQSKLFEVESEKEILCEEKTSLTNKMSTVIAKNSDECKKLNELVENLTSEKLILFKEKEQLQNGFDEKNEIINALESQLQTEIQFKIKMQSKLSEVESEKVILQNKFDENNNTIYSLHSQLKTEIQLRDEIQSKLSEVESEKEILCEEKTSLQMEKEMLLKDKEILQNKIDENTNTINSLESQLQTEIQIRNEIQSKLFEVESEKEILCEEKTCLTNKMSTVIAKNSDEYKKLNELVENLTSEKLILLKEKEQLQNGFDERNEIINAIESQLQTEILSKNKMQSKLCEVESEKEILCEEKTENSNACEMLQEELKKLNSEKQILLNEKEQLQNEFDKRNELINSLESQLQTEIQLKNEIQSKLCAVDTDKEILCEEKTSLSNKLSTVIADNSNIYEMLKEEIMKLTNEKEMWLKETEILQNKFDEQNEIINSLESQLQHEIKLRNEVQSKLCEVDSEKSSLNSKLSTVIADNSNMCEMLKEEIKKLISEKETWLKETEILQNKFYEQNEIINSLESQLQTEIKLRNEVQSKLCEVESEKTALNNKMSTVIAENSDTCEMLKEEVKKLTSEKEMLLKEKEILQNKFEEKNETINSLENQLHNEIQLRNEIHTKLCEVESEKEKLCEEKTSVTNKLSTVISENSEACEKLNQRILQDQQASESLQNQVDNSNKKIEGLLEIVKQKNDEFSKQIEEYKGIIEAKTNEVESLVFKNATLHNELNEVKIQLDSKVHSLKDKLIDNENITDKLKATYESQIDNLNVMVSKLTSYLKEKTIEIEATNKEKAQLEEALKKSNEAICLLEEEVKCQKQKHDKLISEFESERVVLKNIVSVTEDVMEDQKLNFDSKFTEVTKRNEELKDHINKLEEQIVTERKNAELTLNDKVDILNIALKDLSDIKDVKKSLEEENLTLKELVSKKIEEIELATSEKNSLKQILESVKNDKTLLEIKMQEFEMLKDNQITDHMNLLKEKENEIKNLREELERLTEAIKQFETLQEALSKERDEIAKQLNEKDTLLETEKNLRISQLDEIQKLQQLQTENLTLQNIIKEKELEIMAMREHFENEIDQNQQIGDQNKVEQKKLLNKCIILEEYQIKAEEELKHRQAKIEVLVSEMETIRNEFAQVEVEKNIHIEKLESELAETKQNYLRYKQEAEKYSNEIGRLRENLNAVNTNTVYNLKKENELLLKAVTNNENMANDKENIPNYREDVAIKIRDLQVHDSAFDNTTSSIDSSKTITDLEKIIQDKNRTITTLRSDITYLKTLIAESENKLLDVTKDLDLSRENCHQLSNQLKKVVLQKNEEIAELRNKITKMSATETRASQIIKVSAKYQAMIIKRIAEIKNNTVLKELTNFGNSANTNGENEHRRSFNAGNITMEDLENFLETTDRHLKRCSEKQIALQKERDRLLEINKINDSEIIAMRKFLTELSVSVKTFNSVKDLYSQKLNKVIALQRTVRREILNLDGRINDATMCKLERGYAAIMQDLSECALNLERWVDRSIVRSISPEKIKQAFMSELDRASLVPTKFQNTSLEIQFGELESSFHKLLKEVMQAQSGDGAKDAQALTIMEVRAEYEDKLSRMKTKMKELYVDQISQFQEKHKKVIEEYERKLEKANEETKELSKAYQQHIRSLTTELWNVGEKFIIQKDEAQWLRKQQKSGSLMSLQHVHSTGLAVPHEDAGRPSDTLSLRSLQVHNKNERKGRKTCGDMSDEEGEVFDNRCLRELTETPRRGRASGVGVGGAGGGAMKRLSELQRRNTLCQPHLKSSYPAETQFVPGVQEDDIKCNSMSLGGKAQRKEVGITAYKKPGPPTPSKQAGRLSATDSELRESLRVDSEPGARRTATPSRLFGLFRGKQDTIEGTPRGRRLSNIFRKK